MALAHNAALFHGISKCTPVDDIYACETCPISVSDKLFLLTCVLASFLSRGGIDGGRGTNVRFVLVNAVI